MKLRLIAILLLAACAFGQYSEPICSTHPWAKLYPVKGFCGLCYQDSINAARFSDIEKRLKALENPVATQASRWEVIVADSNFGGIGRIMTLDEAIHGRFYPVLSNVRSDSVLERAHGRFYCDLAGHSWAWGDTTYYETHFCWPKRKVFNCEGICRTCLADTTATWPADKKPTEYEMLKQQKEQK